MFRGTLSAFEAQHDSYATGVGEWSVADGPIRSYSFRLTVADDNEAQGLTAEPDFVWEAHSS